MSTFNSKKFVVMSEVSKASRITNTALAGKDSLQDGDTKKTTKPGKNVKRQRQNKCLAVTLLRKDSERPNANII